jgi:hypothetical protein
MKKLVFGLIATVMLSVSSYGQKISDLNQDPNFISYVNNELGFKERANLSLLKEIINVPITKENIDFFYKTYSTNEKEFISFMNAQNLILRDFSDKYNFKSYSENELLIILNTEVTEVLQSTSKINRCRDKYVNSLGINLCAAIAGHVACGAADITVFLGILCHGAVLTGQHLANQNAYLDYLDCMGN